MLGVADLLQEAHREIILGEVKDLEAVDGGAGHRGPRGSLPLNEPPTTAGGGGGTMLHPRDLPQVEGEGGTLPSRT